MKNGLLKLYISFTIKQMKFQIILTFYSTIYMIRAPDYHWRAVAPAADLVALNM